MLAVSANQLRHKAAKLVHDELAGVELVQVYRFQLGVTGPF